MPREPVEHARVERLLERDVELGNGPELPAARPLLTTGCQQPDRPRHLPRCSALQRTSCLRLSLPADVDAADRRPDGDRVALEKREAAHEQREHTHRCDEGDHDLQHTAAARRPLSTELMNGPVLTS